MIRRVSILTVLGLVIGLVVGVLAVGFVEAVLWLNDVFFLSPARREVMQNPGWLVAMTIGVPAVGGLVVGFLSKLMPDGRFCGPADAIGTAQSANSRMPVRSGVLSALASCISLGSGASVGQYGPLAHMGASAGSWLSQFAEDERSMRTIGIGCGAAAAIAAAFHAPLAGLVFAREVILRHNSLRAFAPIAIAATLGYVVAHVVFKRAPLFRIEELIVASPYEYLVFIAIGIAGAFVAIFYMRAIEYSANLAGKLNWPVPIKTALAGLALGIVALQIPDVLGIGQEALRYAMTGDAFSAVELAQLMLAKLLLTALCLGFGFAGGVFSPALLIGTLFGALIGSGAEWLVGNNHSDIAVYAVCGMVAVASPVIGAPLTSVLIVFELTQNFDLSTAALVSVACANLIAYRLFGRSFFDKQLQTRGFDLSLGRDKVTVQQHLIRPLLSQAYTKGKPQDSLAHIRDALVKDKRGEAYVVDADGTYIGTLHLHCLMALVAAGTDFEDAAGEHAEPERLTLHPDASIWTAMAALENFSGESVPVLEDGRLLGVLYELEVIRSYLKILESIRQEENAAV